MTIRVIAGTDFKANASRILEDTAGQRVEVVAELCDCHCDKGYVTLRVVDVPEAARPGGQWPDPEFATREPPFARSLAPKWGMICPHCQSRLHVQEPAYLHTGFPYYVCPFCGGHYREPAGALSVAEARRRPALSLKPTTELSKSIAPTWGPPEAKP